MSNARSHSLAATLVFVTGTAIASEPRPDALLVVDMHREAIVARTVAAWPEHLAGERAETLRSTLWGLRADRLLAVSLSPGLDGLLAVLGTAERVDTAAHETHVLTKALGDPAADLLYSPLTPCRIADTRAAVGALVANTTRTLLGYHASTFASQGGTATSCGIPNGVAALAMNVYAVNPSNLGFIKLWASNQGEPAVSTVNYQPPTVAIATGAIVPVNATDSNKFNARSPAGVHLVVDVVGYFRSATAPGAGLRIERHPTVDTVNTVNGSSANGVNAGVRGATIAGGGLPMGDTDPDFGGEAPNRVTDAYGTIGGGFGNIAGDNAGTPIDRPFATVGGGLKNVAAGFFSVVAGGYANLASGGTAAVLGGQINEAFGNFATVGGGDFNTAYGNLSVVSGGAVNSAVGGGSVVGGGYGNNAGGSYSAISGGYNNSANGDYGVAMGVNAHADSPNCVVVGLWSSGNAVDCLGSSSVMRIAANHGFSVDYLSPRIDGGGNRWVYIGDVFAGRTLNAWNNAHLTDAGVWVNGSSSVHTKTDFASVDTEAVLDRVVAMPVTTWRYREGEAGVRHIGPMAEDFHAAFGVGYGAHTIADLDARGVAFAAIQGLNARLEQRVGEQAREIAALRERQGEMVLLRAELAAMRASVMELAGMRRVQLSSAHCAFDRQDRPGSRCRLSVDD